MLEAIDLTKIYNGYTALNKLNLRVGAGEIFCLLGQNGAGKTTTINLFLSFIAPTSGKAMINNHEVKVNDISSKKFVAYIPEVVMLYGNLTALENLDFFSRLAGFKYNKPMLENYLIQAGQNPAVLNKRVETFSKGMRQKVGIAIAIAKNAEVVFMDEPTSGLDPKAINEFTEIVKELGRQGKAVFMATHDIFHAVNVSTRIGIMKKGEMIHTEYTNRINASDLQQLYLDSI